MTNLVKTLREDFGLQLGFRTIQRSYGVHWPTEFMVQHASGQAPQPVAWGTTHFWEMCLNDRRFWKEKVARIVAIGRQGMKFLMVDEMDWRGPCHNPAHDHPVPSTPLDHIRAVMELSREVRRQCPEMILETHDPVWPWFGSRYLPTYFQQGFGTRGAFDENWGFEYMWNCIADLKTGKALALYYYNLGCNIPLYLHITMAADNDNAVFFWWAASTVRHLGIGGKIGHPSVEFLGKPAPFDSEQRFALYQEQMRLYRQLKPYFVRGTFIGLAENIHLHTLPGKEGGVINLFNLTDAEKEFEFAVPRSILGASRDLTVTGVHAEWRSDSVLIRHKLPAMTPAVIKIGI